MNEEDRPRAPQARDSSPTEAGRASQQTLLAVHDHLRQELTQIQEAAEAVALGSIEPSVARSVINRMTMRQNYWNFGAFCSQYCRIVTLHHTIEDRHLFPALHREEAGLAAVLERLSEEHEIIAEVLDRFDRALVNMISNPDDNRGVRRVADELSNALRSHLAYEEEELLGPLGRSSIVV